VQSVCLLLGAHLCCPEESLTCVQSVQRLWAWHTNQVSESSIITGSPRLWHGWGCGPSEGSLLYPPAWEPQCCCRWLSGLIIYIY
jgi:hypothetical protein